MVENNRVFGKVWKGLLCVITGVIIWFLPAPVGVKTEAWHVLAIFTATIVAFILQPIPMGASAIIGCMALHVCKVLKAGDALAGFSNTTIWLIVSAFMFAAGFVKTGLGKRIAYMLLSAFGTSTLRVAYVLSTADLIIAPFTPSNTARGGGIIYPIVRSVCEAIGAKSEEGINTRTGAFLVYSAYTAVITSACIFLTGASNNLLALQLSKDLFGIEFGWGTWFIACALPGLLLSIITPWILYKLINPELKETPEMKELAQSELHSMGPITKQEKTLCVIFLSALFLWATSSWHGIDSAFVALLGLSAMIVTRCINWDDVLNQKGAWDTLIWMGVLINMAAFLSKFGFMDWLAKSVSAQLVGTSWFMMLIIASAVYTYAHYALASNSAHVAAMFGAFAAVLIAAGAPAVGVLIFLAVLANTSSFLTHYGCGVTPIFFGANYMGQGEWWKIGFIITLVHFVVWLAIGFPWMNMMGLF